MERKLSEKFTLDKIEIKEKYYYTYKVENLIDGKFYIGSHRTSDLLDNYMGSGLVLNRAISKHGKENFKFNILQFHTSSKEMLAAEAMLLSFEVVSDTQCYNLCWYDKNNLNLGPITTHGSKWVTNDITELFLRNSDIEIFLNENNTYRLGRMPHDNYVSIEGKLRQSLATKDKITFYNPQKNTRKYFKKEEINDNLIQELENIGYTVSSTIFNKTNSATKGKHAITNGVENRYVKPDEVEKFCKLGWRYGKTVNMDNVKNKTRSSEATIKSVCEYINSVDMNSVPVVEIKTHIIKKLDLLESYFNKFIKRLPTNKYSSKYINVGKLQEFIKKLKLS